MGPTGTTAFIKNLTERSGAQSSKLWTNEQQTDEGGVELTVPFTCRNKQFSLNLVGLQYVDYKTCKNDQKNQFHRWQAQQCVPNDAIVCVGEASAFRTSLEDINRLHDIGRLSSSDKNPLLVIIAEDSGSAQASKDTLDLLTEISSKFVACTSTTMTDDSVNRVLEHLFGCLAGKQSGAVLDLSATINWDGGAAKQDAAVAPAGNAGTASGGGGKCCILQ